MAETHEAELTKPGLHDIEGYCFSVGVYRSTGKTDGDLATTEEGATLVAFANYLAAALIIDDVPRGVTEALKVAVRKSAAEKVIEHLRVSGIDEIDEDIDEAGNVRVVVAVQQTAIDAEKRHWDGCVDLIRESATEGNIADALLWSEVLAATGRDTNPAIDAWTKKLCEKPGLAATIKGTPIGVADGWTKLPEKIEAAKIAGLSDERLLELIDRRPFDGNLIDAYRDRLSAAGHRVAGKATQAWHRVARSKETVGPAALAATLRVAGIDEHSEASGVAIVLRYTDSWPIFKGKKAAPETIALFREGEITKCLRALLTEFVSTPNADCVNFIAACLLASGDAVAAEPWARLAITWCPTHPFASVNLMLSLEIQNRVREAQSIATQLSGKEFLEPWGKAEVSRVLSPPVPAAILSPSPVTSESPPGSADKSVNIP